jgi:hypothetical protein
MKKILYSILMCTALVLCAGCSTDEINYFDGNEYISFNEPVASGQDYPSISHTFTFKDASVTTDTINIPVVFAGRYMDKDAEFAFKVIDTLTTAKADVHYRILNPEKQIIQAHKNVGSAKILLIRTADMKTASYQLTLQLVENNKFKIGEVDKVQVSITDQLVKPDWWVSTVYGRFLGSYSPTKLLLWLEFMGVNDGSDPFDTSEYIVWLDRGTGNFIYKSYKEGLIKLKTQAFRNWLRTAKGNPYDDDLKMPVSESLGDY